MPPFRLGRTLLLRAKAEESYIKADSAIKLSKLKNTVAKASSTYRSGSLAMLWRARVRKGHGGWTGPLRVLLQEGSTVWLATGATLVRAKLNQLRPCTERQQLVTSRFHSRVTNPSIGCWPRYLVAGLPEKKTFRRCQRRDSQKTSSRRTWSQPKFW